MRLIDADALKKYIMGYASKPTYTQALYLKAIEEQQTAYDVGKVVEEFDSKIKAIRNTKYIENELQNIAIQTIIINVISDLEQIVKQGGVYDDCCEWRYNDTEYCLESSCNHLQIFMDDCPKQNEYSFCPYCGKKMKVVK